MSSANFARLPCRRRVIVLGNNPTVEAAVAAIKEGAADYLHEPCSAEELRAALRQIETSRHAGAVAGGAESAADVVHAAKALKECSAPAPPCARSSP